MARSLVLGNGRTVAALDSFARIRNLCYPYVGKEDHVKGHHHRMGVWVDNQMKWFEEGQGWDGYPKYKKDTLVGESVFVNPEIGIEVSLTDTIHHEKDIYLRRIVVKNLKNKKRDVKVFLNQHFHIGGDNTGDTSFYDPFNKCIISYKGYRYFLINGRHKKRSMSQYATGGAEEGQKIGTWVDGNDGRLSKNPIEHGSVDSTISFDFSLDAEGSEVVRYWICIGKKMGEVRKLNSHVLEKGLDEIINDTQSHWISWLDSHPTNFYELDEPIVDLFRKSLLIIRAMADRNGGIVSAIDSDIMGNKRDNYNYVWPRDGALVARSLDKTGYAQITDRFFEFCSEVISNEGYLFHKYLPDKSVGSTWHPWIKDGRIQLPIQEDETALVLDALWKKYERYQDNKLIKKLYEPFIKKAGDFLLSYRDPKTKLPKETYDLWEEKLGIHTFTCSTVYAGLMGAYRLSSVLGKKNDSERYKKGAEEVKKAMLKHLYDPKDKMFVKSVYRDEKKKLRKDKTVDISTAYSLFEFGILDIDDIKMEETMNKTMARLHNNSKTGGALRYEDDSYFRTKARSKGNPWFISTLWIAEYHIAKAKNIEELKPANDIFHWVAKNALLSGVLPEQLDPDTGEALSVSPLTWSHSAYIVAIIKYLEKLEKLETKKK